MDLVTTINTLSGFLISSTVSGITYDLVKVFGKKTWNKLQNLAKENKRQDIEQVLEIALDSNPELETKLNNLIEENQELKKELEKFQTENKTIIEQQNNVQENYGIIAENINNLTFNQKEEVKKN